MQAIQTRYVCPTNFRGSRIKAVCARGSIVLSWDDSMNSDENHVSAAKALCAKFNAEDVKEYGERANLRGSTWMKSFASGQLRDGTYVHVFTS